VSAEDSARDAEIHALVKRLARPHSSGGEVVERAALLASGSDFGAVMAWITDHAGVAETMGSEPARRGLHVRSSLCLAEPTRGRHAASSFRLAP